jgi:hypothetical protein
MQPAMNNAPNTSSASDRHGDQKWAGKTQPTMERGISDLKSFAEAADIKAVAGDISRKVTDLSGDLYRDSVSFVKRYPVSSALSLAAVGFLAGIFTARSRS